MDAAYKILTDANHQILGAHILSDHAFWLINTIKQAMLHGTSVDELYRQTIASPYPTRERDLSEDVLANHEQSQLGHIFNGVSDTLPAKSAVLDAAVDAW